VSQAIEPGFLAQLVEAVQHYNTRVVLAGVSLLAACAGVIGCFAVLRRRSLTGDALAHAALPGVCLAFLLVGEKSLAEMLLGAFVTGLLGILLITFLRHWTRLKDDAAIGIVLGVFFGAGSVLSSIIQKIPDMGGERAGLASFIYGKTAGILYDDVLLIGFLTLAALGVVVLFFKEFKLVSFDPAFAKVQGWPALGLDLMLMMLVAIAVIIGLPAVGVVMMAALLILPAVTARYWTNRLHVLLVLAALFGALMGTTGTLLSAVDRRLPAGPAIILVGAGLFGLSLLFAPRRGTLAQLLAQRRFRQQLRDGRLSLTDDSHEGFPTENGTARELLKKDARHD
jgi:manganese/zinc/iron transport system permease protein